MYKAIVIVISTILMTIAVTIRPAVGTSWYSCLLMQAVCLIGE
ncbi:Uncharacterised protein [Yersinia frederiksenii]|nr:Uncharacterised protein [Yersinia frederiksenii]